MRKPYTLDTKDVTLSLSKDPYGPSQKQDLGKTLHIGTGPYLTLKT